MRACRRDHDRRHDDSFSYRGMLETASTTTWTRRCGCASGARTRLLRHDNGPRSPGIGADPLHLSGGRVLEEPVESLTGVGHLQGSAGPLHGAELRGAHAGACRRLRHALWQQDLRPDLQALGGTGDTARLQGVESPTTNEDRAVLGVLRCRNDDALGSAGSHVPQRAPESTRTLRKPPLQLLSCVLR